MSGGESGSSVTIHHEPDASKADENGWKEIVVEEAASILMEDLEQLDPKTPDQATLLNLEANVQAMLRRIGGRVVEHLVQQGVAKFAADRPRCPGCLRPMEVAHGARSRHLVGLTGDFEVVRPEYRCRPCSAHEVPADRLIGLGPGLLSPALSRVVARSAAEIPSFERAADHVGEALGISLEAMTVERTAEALGHVAEQEIQTQMAALEPVESALPSADQPAAAPVLPDDAQTLLVGADGGRVHAGGEWREVKIGVASRLGPKLELRDDKMRLALGPRIYAAGLEEADRFFDRLSVVVNEVRGDDTGPVRIVFVGDGGPWIWQRVGFVARPEDEVVEVLDIYHAREHLHALAQTVFRTEGEAKAWAKTVGEQMETEGSQPVLEALNALRPRGKKQRHEVKKAIDYFTTNACRMDYPTYAAHHWPIGSGIVESTCRLVSNLRTKEPGMRWSEAGVQAILSLRALSLSNDNLWQEFFRRQPQRRRPPVAVLTRSTPATASAARHAAAA